MPSVQSYITVQQLYIAYYQRPADPGGLRYWADRLDANGGNLNEIDDAFGTSAETEALYGPINSSTIGSVIDAVYLALFDRVPDPAGKQFYIDGFNNGTFTAASLAYNILVGAQNDDAVAVLNKTQVANYFTEAVDGRPLTDPNFGQGSDFAATYDGDADAVAARAMLAGVTSDPATVLSQFQVVAFIQTVIADPGDPILDQITGDTFALTTSVDNIQIVTAGTKDLVNGIVDGNGDADTSNATFSVGDIIDGNNNTDLRLIALESGDAAFATVKDVSNINLVAADNVSIYFNAADWSNIGAVNVTGGADGMYASFDGLNDGADLSIASGVSASMSVDYTGGNEAYISADHDSTVSFIDTNVSASVAASESVYFELWDDNGGDVTLGTVTGTVGSSGYLWVSASSEGGGAVTVGDVNITVGKNGSASVSVSASSNDATADVTVGNVTFSGNKADDASLYVYNYGEYPGDVTVGDVSMTGFTDIDLQITRSNTTSDADPGNVTVGNVTLAVDKSGSISATISNTAYNLGAGDLTVGDITLTLGENAEGSLSISNYASNYAVGDDVTVGNTTIGNIVVDLATDASLEFSLSVTAAASTGVGTVGNVTIGDLTIDQAVNTTFTGDISVEAYGGGGVIGDFMMGDVFAALNDGAYYSLSVDISASDEIGDVTIGDITVAAVNGVSADIYNSFSVSAWSGDVGNVTIGDVSITLGERAYASSDFYVYAENNIASFSMGDVTLTLGDSAYHDSFSVTVEAWSGDIGAVSFGDLTVTVGESATADSIDYYVSAEDEIASVTMGDISVDVADSGEFSGELYLYGQSNADIGAISIGDISLTAGSSASATYAIYAYNFDDIESQTVGNVALSAAGDGAYVYLSNTLESDGGGDIGAITYGDLSVMADGVDAQARLYVSASSADTIGTMTFGDVTLSVDTGGTTLALTASVSVTISNDVGGITVGDIDLSTASLRTGTTDLSQVSADFSLVGVGPVTVGNITVSGGDGKVDNFEVLTDWLSLTGSSKTIGSVDYSAYGAKATIDVSGFKGAASITGSAKADTITDNKGTNTIKGGGGADTFAFVDGNTGKTEATADQITDWTYATDTIDITPAINIGNYAEGSNADFAAFLTAANAANKAVYAGDTGSNIFLAVDYNTDNTVDFVIELVGIGNLNEIDVASFT